MQAGRPREFDVDAALDAALGVFWRSGYEGASLSDLTAAMGINRPSLYAAFGNKQSLYRRAMEHYSQRAGGAIGAALAEPTAKAAVERLLRWTADAVSAAGKGEKPAGCFLVVSAMSCRAESDAVRKEAAARRREAGKLLRKRLEQAAAEGELPAEVDVESLADFFTTVMHGLSIQAANGTSREGLQRAVDVAMRAWPAPGRNGRRAGK